MESPHSKPIIIPKSVVESLELPNVHDFVKAVADNSSETYKAFKNLQCEFTTQQNKERTPLRVSQAIKDEQLS
eukprot:934283-Alexandrium_andersonii.AAC.1